MGFLLSILLMFTCSVLIQWRYSYKYAEKHKAYIAYASALFIICFWVIDTLVIFGVFDRLLIYLNFIPGVSLPTTGTGLYWYFNCLLLGIFNLGVPIGYGSVFFALVLETLYMPVFRDGQGWGVALFGKRANQKGLLPLLLPLKKPENWREMQKKWEEEEPKRKANEEEAEKIIAEGLELAEKLGMKDKIRGFKR
ncbi:MAG: hypothetical protein ACTSVY_15905 [Candidatus Helarchaeota archaeon]